VRLFPLFSESTLELRSCLTRNFSVCRGQEGITAPIAASLYDDRQGLGITPADPELVRRSPCISHFCVL